MISAVETTATSLLHFGLGSVHIAKTFDAQSALPEDGTMHATDELSELVQHLRRENLALLSDLPMPEQREHLERENRRLREARAQHVYDSPQKA